MAETATTTPAKTEGEARSRSTMPQVRHPFESLRREMNRLFDDIDRDFLPLPFRRSAFETEPFWRRELTWAAMPAVDIAETDGAYEITADLPGMDEKSVEVKLVNDYLTIRGEKREEKEEEKRGYHLRERRFGSFERSFRIPEGVDAGKIEANFRNGTLTVTLPKTPEARRPEKKIEVKSA